MPNDEYFLAERTPCRFAASPLVCFRSLVTRNVVHARSQSSEYEQTPLAIAAKGKTYFRVQMCPNRNCADGSPCAAAAANNATAQCSEDFVLYAPNCGQITITELEPGVDEINWCPKSISDGN